MKEKMDILKAAADRHFKEKQPGGFKITQVWSGGCETRKDREVGNFKGGKGDEAFYVKTFDDDGNACYMAICDDDEAAEMFHDWSQADVGSTNSNYKDRETKEWKAFIG